MIGVAARPGELQAVREFFELFKTPWEPLVPGKPYQVVLIADGQTEPRGAALALIYGAGEHPGDRRHQLTVSPLDGPLTARWNRCEVPLYTGAAALRGVQRASLTTSDGRPLDCARTINGRVVRRIGVNLFQEVARLLSKGQPASQAHNPTLELHIEYLRRALEEAGIGYVEVPPRPADAEFICCLTHDIDFFGIRRHKADRTLAGFALRGTIGTFVDVVRSRRPVGEALRNWGAVLVLPLVFIGLRRDLWNPFRDYAVADRGHKSTFFLVPFDNEPGVAPDGTVARHRAVAYGIEHIREEIQQARGPRTEFAVHGIDAWRSAERGLAEKRELLRVTEQPRTGVRMHWLYFSEDAGKHLEQAGFEYDSTWGYNDAVGFRAGTLQAFRLPETERLLELPLAIMDSAMFYRQRMGLSHEAARERCSAIVQQARRHGGALVINWHDRSLAPERQWGRCYNELLDEIEACGGWFATASEATDWFRWRRSIRFAEEPDRQIAVSAPPVPSGLPAGRVVVRGPGLYGETLFHGGSCRLRC